MHDVIYGIGIMVVFLGATYALGWVIDWIKMGIGK